MTARFENRVVIITGAGRGIGRALALAFAAEGARVVANDINPIGAEDTAAHIVAAGGEAIAAVADVASRMAVQTFMYETIDRWGRIDVLVNNAAVAPVASLLKLDEYDWERTLNVNLKGAFLCMQTAARAMQAQGDGGAIINLTAIAGQAPTQYNQAAYIASKMGLVGLTHEAARELAPAGIRVNAVAPGVVETPLMARQLDDPVQRAAWQQAIPLGRFAQPDDITAVVLFLCSDAARYITGQTVHVNGGQTPS